MRFVRQRMLVFGLVAISSMLGGDVFAGCGGGGGGRRGGGRSSGGRSSPRTGSRTVKKKFVRYPLPAEATVKELDTSEIDELISKIEVNEKQTKKIDEQKKKLKEESGKLSKQQQEAREKYNKTNDQNSATRAAQKVKQTMAAITAFDPEKKFVLALGKILTKGQYSKYKELSAKAKDE